MAHITSVGMETPVKKGVGTSLTVDKGTTLDSETM